MPRIITNIHNLPASIVQAVQLDTHKQLGDISVTQLIDAPQVRMLKRNNTIKEDVMDMMYALNGTAMHAILERAEIKSTEARQLMEAVGIMSQIADKKGDERIKKASEYVEALAKSEYPHGFNDDVMTEKTLVIEVDGMTISGTFDRYIKSEKKLQDYKNTSVYEFIFPESRQKRWMQFNIYAAMLRLHGYEVDIAEVVYFFRDWSRTHLKQNKDYPPHPIFLDPKVPLLTQEVCMQYIKKRVELHKAAEAGENVECTGKERWSNADTYAIMVPGRKRAVKLADSKEMAESIIKSEGHKYVDPFVQVRPGEDKRCAEFCPVRDFCPQRKKRLELLSNIEE